MKAISVGRVVWQRGGRAAVRDAHTGEKIGTVRLDVHTEKSR